MFVCDGLRKGGQINHGDQGQGNQVGRGKKIELWFLMRVSTVKGQLMGIQKLGKLNKRPNVAAKCPNAFNCHLRIITPLYGSTNTIYLGLCVYRTVQVEILVEYEFLYFSELVAHHGNNCREGKRPINSTNLHSSRSQHVATQYITAQNGM